MTKRNIRTREETMRKTTACWMGARWSLAVLFFSTAVWAPNAIAATCVPDATTACLIGGRYKVTSFWRNQYAGGQVNTLNVTRRTDATAAFWLTDPNTYEYLIRINTATDNGRVWISIPTFTDVEFFVKVEDLGVVNGQSKTYTNGTDPAHNKDLIYDPFFFVYP